MLGGQAAAVAASGPGGYAAVPEEEGEEGGAELEPLTAGGGELAPGKQKSAGAAGPGGGRRSLRGLCGGAGSGTIRVCIGLDLCRSFYGARASRARLPARRA